MRYNGRKGSDLHVITADNRMSQRMGEEDPVTQTMIVLGETLSGPRAQVRALIAQCGLAQVQEWIARAREIEDAGGMLMTGSQGTHLSAWPRQRLSQDDHGLRDRIFFTHTL